jgi:hypothetical protein
MAVAKQKSTRSDMFMAILRAEEIYEQHIKPLPEAEQLRLVELIVHQLATAAQHTLQPQRSLLELEGLGADLWQGIDAQQYVDELRKE